MKYNQLLYILLTSYGDKTLKCTQIIDTKILSFVSILILSRLSLPIP